MALLIDQTARRYKTRPSRLLGIQDEFIALDFDLALAERGRRDAWLSIEGRAVDDKGEPDWFARVVLLLMELV
jgi:hypothetical protein